MEQIPLRDLEATFMRYVDDRRSKRVDSIDEADGVLFGCPKCFAENGGMVGTHMVMCWFSGRVPADCPPLPGRWNPSGTSLDDLTFVGPGSTSVLLNGGCGWHGFVKNGRAG